MLHKVVSISIVDFRMFDNAIPIHSSSPGLPGFLWRRLNVSSFLGILLMTGRSTDTPKKLGTLRGEPIE